VAPSHDERVDGRLLAVPDASLTPPDAIVALRSLPRRFRATVMPTPDDMPTPEAVGIALDAAGRAAEELDAIGAQLRRVVVNDNPELVAPPPAEPGDPGTALDRLTASANAVAELAQSQPASAWVRTGRRGGSTVTAADLLREAVGAGVAELRTAERAWNGGDRDGE
jgi:hypothetical protein